MRFPCQLVFGRDTFDEPEPGLGLLSYEEGVRLYGTRFSHPRAPGKRQSYYGITPLFSGNGLVDLLAFFERTAVERTETPWDGTHHLDLGQGFHLASYPDDRGQKIRLFVEAFDSIYPEHDRECWGAVEVEIGLARPTFHLFLVVLREISLLASRTG